MWDRCTWDPEKGPTLPILLCGIVRSELNHEKEAAENREETEQATLAEPTTAPDAIPTPEDALLAREEQQEDDVRAAAEQEWLRRAFEEAGDEVNLLWLRLALAGVPHDEPAAMAKASGRDVNDFYRAQERRKRHLKRLLAHRDAAGNDDEENG